MLIFIEFPEYNGSMHKLVILIEPLENWEVFEAGFPDFLHLAEEMPGLLRETIGRVDDHLYGRFHVQQMHELYFESREAAEKAMASATGRAAGRLLQRITEGRVVLFFSDHMEDDLENIRRYRQPKTEEQEQD